jgi:hypothetical protein
MPESLGPSARTLTARGPWGFGEGVVSSDHISRWKLAIAHAERLHGTWVNALSKVEQGRGLRTDAHGSIYRKAGRADGTDVPSYREPTFVSERRERALPVQDRRINIRGVRRSGPDEVLGGIFVG